MATKSKQTQKAEVPVEVLSALLDYYSDRATSFASLFVASVFGLVTLSTIIYGNSAESLWYYIAGIPYFAFVLAGIYTWSRFSFYAGIAHNIELHGLRERHQREIEKIPFKIEVGNHIYNTDLYEDIDYKCSEQSYQPIKALLNSRRYIFAFLYSILIVTLTIITYWNLIIKYWNFLLDFFNLSDPFVNWNWDVIVPILILVLILIGIVLLCKNRKAKKKLYEGRMKKLERQQNNPPAT